MTCVTTDPKLKHSYVRFNYVTMDPLDKTVTTTETSLIIEEGVISMDDFYNEIIRLFKLETWFGRNLDAFNGVYGWLR